MNNFSLRHNDNQMLLIILSFPIFVFLHKLIMTLPLDGTLIKISAMMLGLIYLGAWGFGLGYKSYELWKLKKGV